MYTPMTLIFAALTFLLDFVVATPPACLIAALQVQSNPADVASLCGTLQRQMEGNITEKCNGDANAVMSVYADTCKAKGVTISIPSSTSSSSKTGSASATSTGSGSSASTTGSGSSAAATSGSGSSGSSGSSTATGSAASASATGHNAGSALSAQTPVVLVSICLGSFFAGIFL